MGGARAADGDHVLVTRHLLRERHPKLSILVAEDNPVIRTLATRMLEKRGHRVSTVDNGRKAFDAVGREHFDLVLMDVQMPEMDGLAAAKAIRERERQTGTHLPIVALTARAMKGDRERCLAAGMDGYVGKPLKASELFRAIESVAVSGGDDERAPSSQAPQFGRVLDRELMLENVAGQHALLAEIIAVYRQDVPRLVGELRAAIMREDATAIERAAHQIKGVLGTLGAEPAAEAAARLEALGADNSLDRAGCVLSALEHELDRLAPELDSLLSSPPDAEVAQCA